MKLLFLFAFGLISETLCAQNGRYDTIQYAKEYHQQRLILFGSEPVTNSKIIFLGNSITEFGDWKKLLGDSDVVNRGIAGDNTFGVLARLQDVIARKPQKLFIEIGINDISQDIPVDIIVKNIFTIAATVKEKLPRAEIYVTSILPVNDNVKNEYPDAYDKETQINAVNKQLKHYAKRDHFTYIALNKKFKDSNGNLDVKYAAPDGLHLNETGYLLWIKLLRMKKYL